MPPVNFTAGEAAVLISAARFLGMMRVLPFAETLAAAGDKLQAALSRSAQREFLARLVELQYVGVPAKATLPEVRAAGAERIVVVRAVTQAEDPEAAARTLRAGLPG